jgi:hypothetical protein
MEVNGSQWKSMEVNGSQWKSMEVNGSQWKATIANRRGGATTAVCVSEYESWGCESICQLTVY